MGVLGQPVRKFLFVLVILSFFLTAHVQPSLAEEDDEEFLEMLENKTFLFFYENTDERGFTIESTAWPIGSIASSGFYFTSIPIAIERKWITHEEGYQTHISHPFFVIFFFFPPTAHSP